MADIKKFLDQAGVGTLWTRVAEELNKVDAKAVKNAEDLAKVDARLVTAEGEIATLKANQYDDTAVRGLISDNATAIENNGKAIEANGKAIEANAAAIEKLNGDDKTVGSVDYKVAQEVAKILNDADASDIDTLEEIAAWIINDTTGAAGMANDISALEAKMAGVDETVVKTIAAKIEEALKIEGADKYALAADLLALEGTVEDLVEALGEGGSVETQIDNAIAELDADVKSAEVEAGKGVQVEVVEVDGKITNVAVTGNYDEKYDAKGAAATAESNAKAYVDGKDSAMDARVKVLEAIEHNFDAAGSAAQALVDAKAYSDENLATAKAYTDEAYNAIQALTANEIDAAIAAAKAEMNKEA